MTAVAVLTEIPEANQIAVQARHIGTERSRSVQIGKNADQRHAVATGLEQLDVVETNGKEIDVNVRGLIVPRRILALTQLDDTALRPLNGSRPVRPVLRADHHQPCILVPFQYGNMRVRIAAIADRSILQGPRDG